MKSFEEKLRSLELRELPAELKQRVLANATLVATKTEAMEKKEKSIGMLMSLATSKWFLFLILPLLCLGSIGAFAIAIEERGAVDRWEEVRKMLEDAGESLDFESFFPQPVPDEQNFMATPALRGMENNTDPSIWPKQQRIDAINLFQSPNEPQPEGERLDLSTWRIRDAVHEYKFAGTLGPNPEKRILEMLGQDSALFEELAAAAKRPFSQPATPIKARLSGRPVWTLGLGHLSSLMQLAKITSLRALASARLGDREVARDSMAILFKCRDCAFADRSMLSGLVGLSIRGILANRLPDLLREECWTGDDLRWLQEKVSEGDGFEEGLNMFRGEMAFVARGYDEMLLHPKGQRHEMLGIREGGGFESFTLEYLIPDGIFHRNKTTSIQWVYQFGVEPFKARNVEAIRTTEHRLQDEMASLSWLSLDSILASKSIPIAGTVSGKILNSEMQRRMMETGVALERYHRAHGAFPADLEQLVPDFLESVQEDLASIEPGSPILYTPDGDGYQLTATPVGASKEGLNFIR